MVSFNDLTDKPSTYSAAPHDHDDRYYTETELDATTDSASGADKIGVTAIAGVTGTKVQPVLESLKALIDGKQASGSYATTSDLATHKTSGDHDGRYDGRYCKMLKTTMSVAQSGLIRVVHNFNNWATTGSYYCDNPDWGSPVTRFFGAPGSSGASPGSYPESPNVLCHTAPGYGTNTYYITILG